MFQNITPRYEFGHGLSYTSFKFSTHLAVSKTNETALETRYPSGVLSLGGKADLFDEVISVKGSVTNSGRLDGAEVAQLYVTYPAEAGQAPRVLRGFEKVHIKAGKTADVAFSLRRRDVSFWDVAAQEWAVAKGEYTFALGSSSRNIFAAAKITI